MIREELVNTIIRRHTDFLPQKGDSGTFPWHTKRPTLPASRGAPSSPALSLNRGGVRGFRCSTREPVPLRETPIAIDVIDRRKAHRINDAQPHSTGARDRDPHQRGRIRRDHDPSADLGHEAAQEPPAEEVEDLSYGSTTELASVCRRGWCRCGQSDRH
jgi:hypothetical protein